MFRNFTKKLVSEVDLQLLGEFLSPALYRGITFVIFQPLGKTAESSDCRCIRRSIRKVYLTIAF